MLRDTKSPAKSPPPESSNPHPFPAPHLSSPHPCIVETQPVGEQAPQDRMGTGVGGSGRCPELVARSSPRGGAGAIVENLINPPQSAPPWKGSALRGLTRPLQDQWFLREERHPDWE